MKFLILISTDDFAKWLLAVGNNQVPTVTHDWISCPANMIINDSNIPSLINAIYPGVEQIGKL